MKKRLIASIMIVIFSWSSLLWANYPQPTDNPPPPPPPATPDVLTLASQPVLSWADNVLIICVANCGSSNASNLYARYNGGLWPANTQTRIVSQANGIYTIEYLLPGTNTWQPIKWTMLGSLNSVNGTSATRPVPAKKYEKRGNKWEEVENDEWSGVAFPIKVDKKGRPSVFYMVLKNKRTGEIIAPNMNIKITHWGKTIRTLGIVAGLTTSAGLALFYTPAILFWLPLTSM
jgi:hypothetical protein